MALLIISVMLLFIGFLIIYLELDERKSNRLLFSSIIIMVGTLLGFLFFIGRKYNTEDYKVKTIVKTEVVDNKEIKRDTLIYIELK